LYFSLYGGLYVFLIVVGHDFQFFVAEDWGSCGDNYGVCCYGVVFCEEDTNRDKEAGRCEEVEISLFENCK